MSNPYSPGPPPFDPQAHGENVPPPPRSNLAWKILLGLAGGGLLLVLLCAGVGYFVFSNTMSVDPAKVRAVAQDIATVKLPDYFQPTMSMSIMGVRMAFFDGEDHRGVFALLDAADEVRQDRETFEAEMRKKIGDQVNQQHRFDDREELDRRTETFIIKGQPVEMEVVVTESGDGTKFHEISGSFEGAENLAFLFVKAPEDKLTADELRQMIESIE
jgi:hypothetical protein